jgi:pimeloyl-ACP methyl ester carboxylesterase
MSFNNYNSKILNTMSTKKIFRIPLWILMLSFFVLSCRKEDTSQPEYKYFVSKELFTSYTKENINNLINTASLIYPQITDFKSHITSGVELYKLVYNTTIEGEKIKASGILCVPVNNGDYPVLSFQMGTNTLHANAPSKFPTDYEYQMVEVIASMGYIVVIADYPGFGESEQIHHPYLVAEPTVQSLVDMLHSVQEMDEVELPSITVKNEYYLLGYSQGGWATLQLHKALELEYSRDFNLKASSCGAGPYNIYNLTEKILSEETFPMPYYFGYVVDAYSVYHQFTNPVSDIFNQPYASRLDSLYLGTLNAGQINSRLSTNIHELFRPQFITGFRTDPAYESIRQAMIRNSVSAWQTKIPLLMTHGSGDTHVYPSATETMYAELINAGSSPNILKKIIIPGADHLEAAVPAITMGFLFIDNLRNSN